MDAERQKRPKYVAWLPLRQTLSRERLEQLRVRNDTPTPDGLPSHDVRELFGHIAALEDELALANYRANHNFALCAEALAALAEAERQRDECIAMLARCAFACDLAMQYDGVPELRKEIQAFLQGERRDEVPVLAKVDAEAAPLGSVLEREVPGVQSTEAHEAVAALPPGQKQEEICPACGMALSCLGTCDAPFHQGDFLPQARHAQNIIDCMDLSEGGTFYCNDWLWTIVAELDGYAYELRAELAALRKQVAEGEAVWQFLADNPTMTLHWDKDGRSAGWEYTNHKYDVVRHPTPKAAVLRSMELAAMAAQESKAHG